MELRHLRYFLAVGEEQHYGRAARRLHVAQPALSRQIQNVEEEVGFKLFERLPRGVRLSAAGQLFLEDARRILQEVNEAVARAARVARGQSGTLRVGFTESTSWRGVVPGSIRRFREMQPDAELQLQPSPSLVQLEAIRSGRMDAGFVFNMPKAELELDGLLVALEQIELAANIRHAAHRSVGRLACQHHIAVAPSDVGEAHGQHLRRAAAAERSRVADLRLIPLRTQELDKAADRSGGVDR